MNKKLLIIGFIWPEPKSSAAGSRMLQLIDAFQKLHFTVVFASSAKTSDKSFDLHQIGVKTERILLNDNSFDVFLSHLKPDVVMFDRFMTEEQFGWRVAQQCPEAIRILDTEDLHCLRKGRELAVKNGDEFSKDYLQNKFAKREIASIYRCDLSLIISEAEMEILEAEFKIDRNLLCYIPFLLHPILNTRISQLPDFEARQHFIAIGNFLHTPNYDAVLCLKQTIWPLIRKQLPQAELHIYGAYTSQKVKQLHNQKEGFLIKGFAENVKHVMQKSRICLAPLRFGAGLKGKLVDAMQNGTPCIMSSIASEGIFGDISVNGFIANKPIDIANKAVELYLEKSIWEDKQRLGFETVNKRFDMALHIGNLSNVLHKIMNDLTLHRQENFLGQVFMHHTLQSSKYMSKWIEAKNNYK